MNEVDQTSSLYEHIKNRLPEGYGYGDDGAELDDNLEYNHKCWQQSLREGNEGDVGIFEIFTSEETKMSGHSFYWSEISIAVVCINGDIENAKSYLMKAFENIKSNTMSSSVYVQSCKLVNCNPVGKNSENKQMMTLNIKLSYLVDKT